MKHQYEDGGAGTSDGLPLAERGAERLDELLLRREEKIISLKNKKRVERSIRYVAASSVTRFQLFCCYKIKIF